MSQKSMNSVAVFLGAHYGNKEQFKIIAKQLGEYLAKNHYRLVYGGGQDGLMGEVAFSVMDNGGEVFGVTPKNLAEEAMPKEKISELIEVPDMDTRKKIMIDEADAFIVLPGGFGTLEELAQVISWSRIHIIEKPLAILDVNNFYQPLWEWIQASVEVEFASKSNLEFVNYSKSIEEVFSYFHSFFEEK